MPGASIVDGRMGALSLPELAAAVAFVAFAYLALVGVHPLSPRFLDPNAGSGASDPLRQAAYLLVFGVAVAAWLGHRGLDAVRGIPLGVAVVLGYCIASSLWSIDPAISVRRAGQLAVSMVTLFACVDVLGGIRTIRLLRYVLMAVIAADWLAVALSPYAVHLASEPDPHLAGSFRGLHAHKNEAGTVAGIAVLLFAFTFLARRTLAMLIWTLAAAVFLFFTWSKGAAGCTLIGLVFGLVHLRAWRSPHRRVMWLALLALVPILGVIILSLEFDELSRLLSDPRILTGRGEVWHVVSTVIEQRPLFGYGFGAVWGTGHASPIVALTDNWVARVYTAHNGYLETTATLGLVGLMLAGVLLFAAPMARLLGPVQGSPHLRAMLVAWFIFVVFNNVVESVLLSGEGSAWTMQLLVIALLHRRNGRLSARAGT